MVKSKKLLSLFLAVVMVFSVLTVMASAAYTRVETEGTADIDIKYTVEKVGTVPETAAGSAEWSADNIYAVTVWMKSAKPVDTLVAPFHYNKAHFAPITLSDGECTYPYGAGMDQDTYYTDMGEGTIYAYALGDYMNNTGMYTATGATAKTQALAKCIGLGNANSAGVKITTELVSPDHTLYSKWGAGLPANTGVVYAKVDVATNAKTAYLNTLEGIETYTDWVNTFTLYFESITDEDVSGDEFGVFTDDCFTVDGNYDANGKGYYESAAKYQATRPTMNVVSNAVVEAAAPSNPIYHVKNQIQWADKDAGTVNLGVVAGFDVADIAMEFGDDNKSTTVDFVGAIVEMNGVVSDPKFEGYVYSANDGKSYYFRAVINNIPADYNGTDIVVTPLVWVKGETEPRYGEAVTITAADVARYVTNLPE